MTTLEVAQRYVNLKPGGSGRYSGMCPLCGGDNNSNKFVVYTSKDDFHCFGCGINGDAITLLRAVENISCPAAHEAAGKDCNNRDCPAWDGCRLGAKANGETPQRKKKEHKQLEAPMPTEEPQFVPDQAETPEQLWQQQAAALIAKAHDKLLDNQEQIAYLTARGLPIEAICAGKLGWLPENRYPSREAWGLQTELKPGGQKKKMFIPSGILIPFFDADGNPHRIRIRRADPRPEDPRYFWIKGSGNDVPVIGAHKNGKGRRGVVVVESDLDAFMGRWQCRDLDVCFLPLGSVSVKPKAWAMDVLEQALSILVALDSEPRINQETGKHENPGGEASKWWLNQFKRAKRWPVPEGKDPGEYFEQGGNIRQWVLDGLPPVFHVVASQPKQPEQPAAPIIPEHTKGKTVNGHEYVVAHQHQDVNRLRLHYPQIVIFSPDEIKQMKGMKADEAEKALVYKKFGGSIETFIKGLKGAAASDIDLVNLGAEIFEGKIIETKEVDHTTEPAPLPVEPEYHQEDLGI